jgi:hypothetical protein
VEVYSNQCLHKKSSKHSNKQSLHLKELEKEQTIPKTSKIKGIIKIRAEINIIDTKKK